MSFIYIYNKTPHQSSQLILRPHLHPPHSPQRPFVVHLFHLSIVPSFKRTRPCGQIGQLLTSLWRSSLFSPSNSFLGHWSLRRFLLGRFSFPQHVRFQSLLLQSFGLMLRENLNPIIGDRSTRCAKRLSAYRFKFLQLCFRLISIFVGSSLPIISSYPTAIWEKRERSALLRGSR